MATMNPAVRTPPRRRVKVTPDWYAAGVASIVGAFAFMAVEMLFGAFSGRGGPGTALRALASIVFGDALTGQSPETVLMVALCTHLTLSLLYGRALAFFLFKRRGKDWLEVGLVFGFSLYLLNYYALGALVPRIAAARASAWLFSHLAFGAATAAVYERLEDIAEEA